MLRFMLFAFLPLTAWACSCFQPGPACQEAWKASAIFLGTVTDITFDQPRPDAHDASIFLTAHVKFEVTESLLGMEAHGEEIEIRTGRGGGDCGYQFKKNQSYLVYAQDHDLGLITSICSRTASADKADADLTYLRGLRKTIPSSFIYGTAADGEHQHEGISGAAVRLSGNGINKHLTTDKDGAFRFDQLSPGKYNVEMSKSGYSLRNKFQQLDLHAGGCAMVTGSLVVDRRITGKVTGAHGLPAAGLRVELVPTKPDGNNSLPFPVAQATTEADGTYELRDIRPGEYYLGINLAHTPSKQMPYTRYFYPGTEDPSHAGIVAVRQESGAQTFNFPIPAPQKERMVEGFVYWPDGRPAEKAEILLEDLRWPWQTMVISTATDASGHFSVDVFDATTYRIHAINPAPFTNECVSAEPYPLKPDTDLSKPLRLILTRKGHSASELVRTGLDRWRAGLGL